MSSGLIARLDKSSFKNNITGIVLAAGTGKRMGCTKQLLHYAGSTLIEKVVYEVEASSLSEIIVVLGHNAEKILSQTKFSRARTIINSYFGEGQSTSLVAGLLAADHSSNAAMFVLADQPLITKKIINELIQAYPISNNKSIVIPVHKGCRGNPIIFGKDFFGELMSLVGDIGGRALISLYKNCIIEVSIDSNAVLFDVDTYEDYKKIT